MYHLKSSLQVIQSVVQSYDTLIKSVVSKHHQKTTGNYLPCLPTIYLPIIYCQSGHKYEPHTFFGNIV